MRTRFRLSNNVICFRLPPTPDHNSAFRSIFHFDGHRRHRHTQLFIFNVSFIIFNQCVHRKCAEIFAMGQTHTEFYCTFTTHTSLNFRWSRNKTSRWMVEQSHIENSHLMNYRVIVYWECEKKVNIMIFRPEQHVYRSQFACVSGSLTSFNLWYIYIYILEQVGKQYFNGI